MSNKKKADEIEKSLDSFGFEDLGEMLDKSLQISATKDIENVNRQINNTFDVHKARQNDAKLIARNTLMSLFDFYISNKLVSNNTYLQLKMELDTITLETLINQIKINEYAIERLLDLIDSGEGNSKIFDSLSSLQKTYIDLIKAKTMFIISSEEHAKKLRNDVDSYGTISIDDEPKKLAENTVYKGTKDLLKNLQNDIQNNP